MSDPMLEQLEARIREALPDAEVAVEAGSAGHYSLTVVSTAFADQSMLAQQRLVYRAIAPLMAGDQAPVHAIDTLTTRVP